ncbi:hypothetical protein RIF29_44366 [Crotalaria pallida]|uniref:Uncharacterized protein n=1 Tax=Crotalaria pallida TaxID=3830 RepID=A0AAN9DWA1_CROPI
MPPGASMVHCVWFIFLGARCMVPGARYVVPGARCLIPWAWYMVPCPWCAITGAWFGARSVVAGAWCVIPAGAWIPVPGDRSLLLVPWGLLHRALSLVRGSWCMVWCEIHGTWCLVHGAWCLVPGATSVVPGAWCVIPGAWILVHGLVRDPWYLVPGAWCMVPCPWCEIRGTRCMDPGAWSGARSVVPGAWCVVPGAWRLVPGAWIQVHGLVRDPWYPVHGAWCMVRDPWCMVPDPWCMDPGAWSGARSMVPGAWCMVHGALSLVRDPWYAVHGSWCMVWYEIRGTRCMVRDPWCLDPGAWSGARSGVVGALCLVPGGLAGCLPLHHGGSGWCAMGASPNAFSSHPMDVWSVFPWHGGDSRESSVEPNPGRTYPGACWSLGKIRAPWCDMVWHVGCKAEASRERSLVPIGNLGASHDAIISRHERTRVRSSPSAIGAGWHGFFRGGILGDACTRHRCVSRFGTLAKCIKGYHSLRIVPFGNKTWTLRCNPWGVHRETKRDVVALSLGSTCSSWKDAVLGDALTSNRLSRRFTKGRKPR